MKYPIAAFLFWLAALPVQAAPVPVKADAAAIGMVDIFNQTCIAYAGRQARLRLWLDANLQVANDKQTPLFLGALSGKVWLKRDPAASNYAVIVYDVGLCTVKAERAPIDDALTYFEKEAAPKLNMKLTSDSDDPEGSFNDIAGRVHTYGVTFDGVKYEVIASGTQNGGAVLQSQMSLVESTSDDDDTTK